MPFIKREIKPVKIRQGALDKSDISLGEEHEVIVNRSYTQILQQLSQLATFANEIFKDLSQECQAIVIRSHKLKTRVWEIDQSTEKLNVLETPLPEDSLENVGKSVRETTANICRQDTGLFSARTRPEAVQKLYLKADLTPRAVFAALGPQGWKSAKKFCLTPVLKEPGEMIVTLPKYEKKPYKIVYERDADLKPPRPRPRSSAPRPKSCAAILDYKLAAATTKTVLPTPEENLLRNAKSQPSVLVQIDTSTSAFDRFAATRASLKNLQSHKHRYESGTVSLTRRDVRRQTFSGSADLRVSRQRCQCEEQLAISTERLLEDSKPLRSRVKPKNPDHYIEDTAELFKEDRSRSKERRPSLIKKLVQRSRSLPRNIGRDKSREQLIAPDFYDIHPQHSLIVSQNGAIINGRDEKIYTNFYGAPNTELPSPQQEQKMKKSKSDHQITDRVRSKSSSAMEEMKLRLPGGKRRPRSVSAERTHSSTLSADHEDRRYSSLSRTFTGIFGKSKKPKVVTTQQSSAQSKDSLNTVFTNHSDPESVRRQVKRLSTQTMLSTQITLRKRDSKATTTSSSGRWSGSERYSLDSEGLFSLTPQNRLSKVSADRDSALGADINDQRAGSEENRERHSLYSVDQDGFYTTMHTDSFLRQDKNRKHHVIDADDEADDDFGNLSLMTSSTCTSTKTLNTISNEPEKITTPVSEGADNHNSSISSYPDSEQAEAISQRVRNKVEASRRINRYSLVMALSDDEEEDTPPKPPVRKSSIRSSRSRQVSSTISNLKHSKTYESELDLVLEDLSEAETATVCSDSESVVSFRMSRRDTKPKASPRHIDAPKRHLVRSNTTPSDSQSAQATETQKKVVSVTETANSHTQDENLLRYRLLNGCMNYHKLPQPDGVSPTRISSMDDHSRSCKSLPRNMKHTVGNDSLKGLISTLDNMGSWPRKLPRANTLTPSGKMMNMGLLSSVKISATDNGNNSQSQPNYLKRRSLSPGKLKQNLSLVKDEKIHSLIEEARRMSTIGVEKQQEHVTPPRPLSQPEPVLHRLETDSPRSNVELVSPYATCIIEPPEQFIRQPSYRIACSNEVKPMKVIPRSQSDDGGGFTKRNYSYRQANKLLRHQHSDSILEHQVMDSPTTPTDSSESVRTSLTRAPSYRIAQSQSFDRSNRAPSYRKALETIPHERDSGLGSGDMTSSSDSNHSIDQQRLSSYRIATESSNDSLAPATLHHGIIRECMKGVYENEESHLSQAMTVPSNPELVQISTKDDSQHYQVPRIPAQPTSFNPSYVNIEIGTKSKRARKKSLIQSKSAPQGQQTSEDSSSVSKSSLESGKCRTPPARSNRRDRPLSSYVPNGTEDMAMAVPDNRLMLPKYNQAAFTSMEMLKREEMAVLSVLGKIRRSTRPLSYVQTDI